MSSSKREVERVCKQQQRELERKLKEQAKLSAKQQAQLEIEVFENQLEVLLTVHRDCSATFDWMAAVSALPPFQTMGSNPSEYESEFSSWQKTHLLAKKVLKGDLSAYGEALSEISANGELATLGYSIVFRVENHETIACELLVCGNDVIPQETKMLSASGKLASKPMPKGRFHEIYQDYVCGCALRVAREIFALLPVNLVIVTAFIPSVQTSTGKDGEIPVLSVAMPRNVIGSLNFDRLDPSDSMQNFIHRGDVLTSRKTGNFIPILPLTAAELGVSVKTLPCEALWTKVREFRARIAPAIKKSLVKPSEPHSTSSPTA